MNPIGRKQTRAGTGRRRRLVSQSKWPPPLVILTVVGLIVLMGAMLVHSFRENDALRVAEQAVAADWNPSWPPLPRPNAPLARPIAEIQAAYLFAAKHEDVLQYIPCYCGCEVEGHRSNGDCYIRGHTATGAPVWDTHAYTCDLCLNIARDANRWYDEGKTVTEIRQAIETRYAPRQGAGTPTPRPPQGQ